MLKKNLSKKRQKQNACMYELGTGNSQRCTANLTNFNEFYTALINYIFINFQWCYSPRRIRTERYGR